MSEQIFPHMDLEPGYQKSIIFVLTFKAYGPNAVRSMPLECQNKYSPYGPKSWLIRALLYTYPNKTVSDDAVITELERCFLC